MEPRVCKYCGKPLGNELYVGFIMGEKYEDVFCLGTDCMNMYYYEEEREKFEKERLTWLAMNDD